MEQEQIKKLSLKAIIRSINRAVGAFLFVFFMMAQLIIFTSGLKVWDWAMPLFVAPSCLVCLTVGANYWIEKNVSGCIRIGFRISFLRFF
jgi:hypothetical protein